MKIIVMPIGFIVLVAIALLWILANYQKSETEVVNIDTTISADSSQSKQPTETSVLISTATIVMPSATPTEIPPRLSENAIKNCPVTLPNGISHKYGRYYGINHGNEDETIFTILEDDGRWVFWPDGPGEIREDGKLRIKWPWWRTIEGDVRISGARLDANAPRMPEEILRGEEDGYEETGFHPSLLTFPSEGCWEITARVGEESLSFVLLVILRDG